MAIKALNSVAGFSVGEVPVPIILANGDITTINFTSNGSANLGNVANVHIFGGSNGQVLQTDGSGNLSWTSSANVNQIHNGNSNVTIPNLNGNVYINSNSGTDQQWNFTTSGNLVLPLGGIITEGSSPSGLGNTITLTPSGGSNTNQQLVIYPTGVGEGDHIHLTSGNLSSTSIFLGNDTQYIRTRADGSMVIGTDDGQPDTSGIGYRWIFDVDGNLTAPNVGTANLGNLVTANFANFYNDLYAGGNANIVGNLVVQGNIANANNISITNNLEGNTANFSGNITTLNANLGNLVTANYANFANDVVVQGNIANANNISVTNNITSNTANVTGNLTSGNANLGNLATANNFSTNGSGGDITLTGGNVVGANVVIANSFTSNGGVVDFSTNNPNVQLGDVSNVHINGGTNGYLLTTDGSGGLSWTATASTTSITNGTSNVSIPDTNGNVNTSVNGNANVFVVTGLGANVNGNLDASGNLTVQNANLGNLVTANNANFTTQLDGNTANFTGNITSLNADLGNLATANFVNVASNTTTSNLTVNLELSGNTANFSGNVITPNLTVNLELAGNTANFTGNVIAANFIGSLANGNSNVKVYQDANVEITVGGSANTATFASTGLYVVGQINTTAGNMLSNGNITANLFLNSANANVTGQAELGSVLTSNITAPSGNITISAAGSDNNIILAPTGNGTVDTGLHRVTQLGAPVNPNDAATKEYVDNISQGLFIHPAANVTSISNLNSTYDNGGTVLSATTIAGNKTITFSVNHGLVADDNIIFTNTFNGIIGGEAYFVYSVPAPNQITIKDGYFGAEVTTLTNGTGLTQAALGNGGVGATLTNAGAQAALTIDSILMTVGARVLVQGQTNQFENGIYAVTTVGTGATNWILTRASDGNSYAPKSDTALGGGSYFFVMQGSLYAGASYVLTAPPGEIVIGVDNIVFSQFSQAGSYTAGNGISITGTLISANTDNVTTAIVSGNIVVKSSANFTTPNLGDATFSSLSWNNLSNGNVTANNLSISNIANITGNLRVDGIIESNGNVTSNAYINGNNASFTNSANIGGNLLANNITSNNAFSTNTANITSNLVTSNATVNLELSGNTANFSGNVIVPNLTVNLALAGNTANFSGNVIVPNLTVNLALAGNTANFSGNVIVPNLTVNLALAGNTANFSGNITALNANLGNLATANFFTGTFSNGTSNIAIPTTNGNINLTAGGNTSLVVTNTGANVIGNLGVSGNFSVGSLVSANLTANYNVFIGNTTITWSTITTTAITANQTIATVSVTGVTGVEFLVKGIDSSGGKYSVATVQAVTDGANVDYSTFGTVLLGSYTGSLAVNIVGSNISLQVTPASSNSTVWTTQYRII